MKRVFIYMSAVSLFIACNNAPKADNAVTEEKQEAAVTTGDAYALDTANSKITWTGSKPNGKHVGTIKLKDGVLNIKDNALGGGNFTIDVASLTDQDLASDPENKAKLEGHLKSPDFFDIGKYPTAKFEITGVTPFVMDSLNKDVLMKDATHTISGNLTLKDSTKNISFPARVTIDAATIAATANFNIDRTKWGINYKGPGNPQDWVISKTVNLQLMLAASKK